MPYSLVLSSDCRAPPRATGGRKANDGAGCTNMERVCLCAPTSTGSTELPHDVGNNGSSARDDHRDA